MLKTMEEVREYRSGETIECLECGKHFKRLQRKHLGLHGMSAEDYKLVHGIPWSMSLTSKPSRERSSKSNGPVNAATLTYRPVKGCKFPNRRPRQPATADTWSRNARLGPKSVSHGRDGRFESPRISIGTMPMDKAA